MKRPNPRGWIAPKSGGYQPKPPCSRHATAEECVAAKHVPPKGDGGVGRAAVMASPSWLREESL